MNLLGRKTRKSLEAKTDEALYLMGQHAASAMTALFDEDYSKAATACHRAHQQKLVFEALIGVER